MASLSKWQSAFLTTSGDGPSMLPSGYLAHRHCNWPNDTLELWVSEMKHGLKSPMVTVSLSEMQMTERREEMLMEIFAKLTHDLVAYCQTLDAMRVK